MIILFIAGVCFTGVYIPVARKLDREDKERDRSRNDFKVTGISARFVSGTVL